MFPPPFSREPIVSDDANPLTHAYQDVIVYESSDPDDVLYEGPIVVHANGWLELEGNRLLSPSAVHHIDIYDDEIDPAAHSDERPEQDHGVGSDDADGTDEYGF
ncbi:hypothetical protein C482_17523 [Natrialba chahannaoensis JCM 10990]|uniref:Uncharacterized protein n=1 Tax=Natrialba chahannaoensis JCM 10990 TaxID=1227492 RepID=M0AC12_9EURY|nr:hypothetical protein [Natrialba chahannaoensis]ELY94898.1 hypothetical protein C482_17523 [Natrialba chahannaoensis JCM 10990]